MILLMAKSLPTIPTLRDYNVWKVRIVEYDPRVRSPCPSQIGCTSTINSALLENKPTGFIWMVSPLCCDVPYPTGLEISGKYWYRASLHANLRKQHKAHKVIVRFPSSKKKENYSDSWVLLHLLTCTHKKKEKLSSSELEDM